VTAPLAVVAGCAATIAMLQGPQGLDFLRNSGHPFVAMAHDGQIHSHQLDKRAR
jgi:hypothetical protein